MAIVWSSADAEVARKVCFMYAFNARVQGWFDQVHLTVWGPSALLASRDEDIRRDLRRLAETGVVLEACRQCSDAYGVTEALEAVPMEVRFMGKPLSERLLDGWKVLTF